ncbi:MAG: sterol desaturase family protein [Pseudomonadota bacterium]
MERPSTSAAHSGQKSDLDAGSEASSEHVVYSPSMDADTSFKARLINLLPPATVLAVVLFWSLAPDSWRWHSLAFPLAGLITVAFIQIMELVFERHPGWRINRREFATDLFYLFLSYTAISWASSTLAETPLMSIKESLGIATPWLMDLPIVVQAFLVLAIIEFGQYWMHRLMHNWHPLWLTHAPHHHLTQLNAMKGYVGNPIELFLVTLSVVSLFDFDLLAIFCAVNVLGAIVGYVRANPPGFYSFVFTTIRHHSLHHSVGYEETRCNYSNAMILFDRIFGTYREGESAIVGQDERRRLSIIEQFLFPVYGVRDWLKGRSDPAPASDESI